VTSVISSLESGSVAAISIDFFSSEGIDLLPPALRPLEWDLEAAGDDNLSLIYAKLSILSVDWWILDWRSVVEPLLILFFVYNDMELLFFALSFAFLVLLG